MEYGLDIVAVRVERKSGAITRVIRTLARRPVVAAARGERRLVKRLDGLPVRRLKGEVGVLEIPDAQLEMVDQAASVKYHDGLQGFVAKVLQRIVEFHGCRSTSR